jgi:AraC-like DNA-binding protein
MSVKYTKTNPAHIDFIIALLSNYYPISKELATEFHKHAISIYLEKGDHILQQGEICKYMYFIKEGAMTAYSEHNLKKITTYISIENEFLSSLSGLYGKTPSKEAIVAVEPTLLLGVNTDILLGWYEKFFDLNYIIRLVYESYYQDAQERSHIVRVGNAKERYEYFIKSRGSSVERLPNDIIASFLDMKPETLLRIKKQMGQGFTKKDINSLALKIEDYVIKNEGFKNKNISTKILAKELNVSVSKIAYCFSNHYKLSFKDFVNKQRINCFKQLTIEENHLLKLTIESIASTAGFSSRSSFYKIYKQHEGIGPKEHSSTLI